MKTYWKITKEDSNYFDQIFEMFFYNRNIFILNSIFRAWLYDNNNEVLLFKSDKNWNFILSANNLTKVKEPILDIKDLIISLN
jgi:hypothetical protein